MAETTEFVSTIRVRDLISAFESKSESVRVEFTRPRAKSVGNILPKNVIVRQNDFDNLDDIENALKKLDANLNFYEVYNKTKHVAFQEQLFNILTSIVNIEDHEEHATARKKRLISETQTLVSFLNQKLPSNASPSTPANQFKYVSYATHVKENGAAEEKPSVKIQAPYSESTKSIDITDSGAEFFVSVKKLKETFQPRGEAKVEEAPKVEKTVLTPSPQRINGDKPQEPAPVQEKKPGEDQANVSVSKLRNLFEQRSEENSKGLGIIADDKPQANKMIFRSASMNVHIPYTERNLGNVRLQRSVSGHYMNYVGLLKRVDISKSTGDLNKATTEVAEAVSRVRDSSDEDSGAESDETLEEEVEQRKVSDIVRYFDSSAASDSPPSKNDTRTYDADKGNVSIMQAAEDIKERYSAIDEENHDQDYDDDDTSPKSFQEFESHYFTTTNDIKEETAEDQEETVEAAKDQEETPETAKGQEETPETAKGQEETPEAAQDGEEEEVAFSTPEIKTIPQNEGVATVEGAEEVDVTYSTATSNDIEEETDRGEEQTATVEGVGEEEIHFTTAETKDVSETESSATTGVEEVAVSYSTASSDDIKEDSEDVADGKGVEDAAGTSSVTSSTVTHTYVESVEEVPVTTTVTRSTVTHTSVQEVEEVPTTTVTTSTVTHTIVQKVEEVPATSEVTSSTVTRTQVHKVEEAPVTPAANSSTVTETTTSYSVQNHSDAADNASTRPTIGSDDSRRDSALIDEELDKIDVEPTLADEIIELNADDLKNAENEFEKLLESSQT